jgi:hypothetical protein
MPWLGLPNGLTPQEQPRKSSFLFNVWVVWMTGVGIVTSFASTHYFLTRTGRGQEVVRKLDALADTIAPIKTQ